MAKRISRLVLVAAVASSLASATAWAQANKLYMNSQPGDFVGGGTVVTYTAGVFSATRDTAGAVHVSFETPSSDHWWYLDFAPRKGQITQAGMYEGAARYPFQSPTHNGLDVSGDGRGCNTLTGRFLVLDATYDVGGNVLSFAADFEQHCEGGIPALYGAIRVNSSLSVTPRLSIGDAAIVESTAGTAMTFTVSLSQPSPGNVSVHFATADGTALAGSDYVAESGTVSFKPFETSKQITVQTLNDGAAEGNQDFYVNLSSGGVSIADPQGKGTIIDGDGPQTFLVFDSQPGDYIGQGVKQKITVVDGDFTAGPVYSGPEVGVHFEGDTWWDTDFAPPGNAVLTPGTYEAATRFPFQDPSVPGLDISGDGRGCNTLVGRFVVLDATYDLSGQPLSFAAEFEQHCEGQQAPPLYGAIWFNSTAAAIPIFSGAGEYQFSSPSYVAKESSGVAKVAVRRLNGNGSTGSVDYSAFDGTALGTAGPGQDYTQRAGTLIFAGTQSVATLQLPITKDAIHEASESVLLRLSNPQPILEGAELGAQDTAVLTINDDDLGGKIQFSVAAYSVNAAVFGGASARLTVKRSGGLAGGVTVHYATSDGTATAGADYTDSSGDITFVSSGAGATTQALAIPVAQNNVGSKTFTVALSTPTGGAALGAPVSTTVTVLGAQPTVGFGTAAFGAKTTQPSALITVKRSAPLTGTVTVHYATSPGTAVNNGVDYSDVSGDLTFIQGAATKSFSVPITKDVYVDVPKTVALTLTSPTWSLGTAALDPIFATSTLNIVNPNVTPSITFSAPTYVANEMSPKAVIAVKRTGDLAGSLTVDYAATGGSATNGDPLSDPNADYTLAAGTLTFAPKATTAMFPIAIVNDLVDEGTETAVLQLSNVVWAGGTAVIGGGGTATLSIVDNEPTVQFSAAVYNAGEVAKSVVITVKRTGGLTSTATVGYSVTGGSAVPDTGAGGDYVLVSPGTLTFLPGQAAKTLPITLEPDTIVDGSKTIELALSAPTGALLGTPATAIVTVKDDDAAGQVQFGLAASSVAESVGSATIVVTRTGGASSQATIHYATLDADPGTTALAGTDYASTAGTLTFAASQKSATITVPILDDGVPDGGAVSVVLGLDAPGGGLAMGSPAVATLWIVRE